MLEHLVLQLVDLSPTSAFVHVHGLGDFFVCPTIDETAAKDDSVFFVVDVFFNDEPNC
jgi:hypothetical protein